MRLLRFALVLTPLAALLCGILSPRSARSLPLFARENGVPCTTCHLAFPRLNAFGMAFRQNGYRMPGTKGQSPWESKEFPLSLVANVGYSYTDTTGAGRPSRALSQFVQNTVEFHSAGTLAERITFHFDNNFAGVNGPLNSGMAFFQFDDLVHDGGLNFKTGVYDAEIPYLSDSRRTTWTHYLSPVTLAAEGLELNGTRSGWTYAAGLINSSRTHGKLTDKTFNQLEDPYLWIMRDVSGQLATARVFMDRQDPRDTTKSGSPMTQVEASLFLNSGRWVLIPGYTYQKFSDPDPTLLDSTDPANGAHDNISTGLLEGLLFLDKGSRWLLTARYELRHMPKTTKGTDVAAEEDDQQIVANLSWYANPNARIGLEWTHNADNIHGPRIDQAQLFVHTGY